MLSLLFSCSLATWQDTVKDILRGQKIILSVRNLTLLGIFLLLILPWTSKAEDTYQVPAINVLASSIVGQHITVHCMELSNDENGHTIQYTEEGVSHFVPEIWLQKYVCVGLKMLLHYVPKHFTKSSTWQQDRYDLMGLSALVLTHEAYHIILNSANEGIVECAAIHHVRATISRFHLSSLVAKRTWIAALWAHRSLPAAYLTVC